MTGWSNPTPLAVFVLAIALLLAAGTSGALRLPPLRFHGPLTPVGIKVTAALGVLCLGVSGVIALAGTGEPPPPQPSATPIPPPVIYDPTITPASSPETTPPTTTPSPNTSTPPPEPPSDGGPEPTTYLQDLGALGSPNGLNSNPHLSIGKVPYPHSVAVACTVEDSGVVYDAAGYSSLHATVAVGDGTSGPGIADDVACEITVSNNAKGILKTLIVKPSDGPKIFDVQLKGSRQMKISCVPVSKTNAGYEVNYEIGFGNAELRQ
jgi:hypothetical protein